MILYTVRGRHSFQSFDIFYFLIDTSEYTSNATSTRLLIVLVKNSNTFSENSWNVDPKCWLRSLGISRWLWLGQTDPYKTWNWFSSMDQSNLKWDWMSNVSLQSHSLTALPYSLPVLSLLLSLLHQWTSSGSCILFPWIGECTTEQIYQLSYGFDAFSNASWSQLLWDLGLGWNKRRILTKKLIVNTTSKPDVDFSRLDIATNAVLKRSCQFRFVQTDCGPPSEQKTGLCWRLRTLPVFWHTDDECFSEMEWGSSFGNQTQMPMVLPLRCMTGTTPSNRRMMHRWGSASARTVPSTRAEPNFEPFSFIPRT